MRTAIANFISAGIHLVALGGLAAWSLDADGLQYQVASGRPIIIEFSPAPSPAQLAPENITHPISLEVTPFPAPPGPQPEAAALPVTRQQPLLEIAEEVASVEMPPAESPAAKSAQAQPQEPPPPTLSAAPTALPQRTPTNQPPETFAAASLPSTAVAEAGASVDSFPRKLPLNQAPPYPEDAWLARIQGRVVLKVLVQSDGLVRSAAVHLSSGSSSLDDSALTTVRGWRFEPARRRGTAVAHEVLVPVRFTIVTN